MCYATTGNHACCPKLYIIFRPPNVDSMATALVRPVEIAFITIPFVYCFHSLLQRMTNLGVLLCPLTKHWWTDIVCVLYSSGNITITIPNYTAAAYDFIRTFRKGELGRVMLDWPQTHFSQTDPLQQRLNTVFTLAVNPQGLLFGSNLCHTVQRQSHLSSGWWRKEEDSKGVNHSVTHCSLS